MRAPPLTVVLLVLALLFGQAVALVHAASHVGADIQSGQGLPHGDCDDCLAQAALGAALPSAPSILAAGDAGCSASNAPPAATHVAACAAYRSRAPPSVLA
jgi:hypothetical protein